MVYDTSDVIDSSIFLKAKLDKNMVGSNYYIENLQNKRNQDWEYRYNVITIEEEQVKQLEYTRSSPDYTPIEVVISSIKNQGGLELSSDWAKISFKDLKHKCGSGYRYRFPNDFSNNNILNLSEQDKYYDSTVWLGVDKNPFKAGNSCTIRKCNSNLTLLGSPTKSSDYITEIHEEPCILENELKYMQIYYNMTVPVAQAEWYAIMQLNYFTNFIEINDRFLFGTIDTVNRTNNQVFKVKAVIKSTASKTFFKDSEEEIASTKLVTLALDRDVLSPEDVLESRIAKSAPIYLVKESDPVREYYIKNIKNSSNQDAVQRIVLGDEQEYNFGLYFNDDIIENTKFTFTYELKGILQKNWDKYFDFTETSDTSFKIKNKKPCNRGALCITVSCDNPDDSTQKVAQQFDIELGGFY